MTDRNYDIKDKNNNKVSHRHILEIYWLNLNDFAGFTITALPCCKVKRVEHWMILLGF